MAQVLKGYRTGRTKGSRSPTCSKRTGRRRQRWKTHLMAQLDLIAATAFGLESVAARGTPPARLQEQDSGQWPGAVSRPAAAICRANLWLRPADRVLLRLATFPATDFGQLFDGTAAVAWEAWLPADAAFPVNGRSIRSQLSSVPACQKIVKKAIVERLRKKRIAWSNSTKAALSTASKSPCSKTRLRSPSTPRVPA